MSTDVAPAAKDAGFFRRSFGIYQKEAGQTAVVWLLIALCNSILQVVFYRNLVRDEMTAGEFGTLNAALGIVGLLTVPLLAVYQAFHLYPSHPHHPGRQARLDALRPATIPVTESLAWIWGGLCIVLILLPLPLPYLPRFPLQLLTLINVLIALGAVVSHVVCESQGRFRYWAFLLVAAALVRIFLGAFLTSYAPWADAGLAVFLFAGFITLTPALRTRDLDWAERFKALRAIYDHDFLLFSGATLSVLLGIYLFTNADRIVSLRWIDPIADQGALPSSGLQMSFDCYQASGLLGRSLLWGTQPLLWILFAHRSRLKKTKSASLTFFWIYLGTLILGAFALGCLTQPAILRTLGQPLQSAALYGPTFAAVMLPLGLLQGIGIFSLASRRYHECFVLGGCSVAYTLVLAFFGRRPDLMLPYMFGSAVVCLMIVLFVGVVRWGRKQP